MITFVFSLIILFVGLVLLLVSIPKARKYKKLIDAGSRDDETMYMRTAFGVGKLIGVACLPLFLLLFIASVWVSVPAGHVGIIRIFGKVQMASLPEGLHFVEPWAAVVNADIRVQKLLNKYSAASLDMQVVTVDMALNISVDPKLAPWLYREVGFAYPAKIVLPAAQEVLKATTAKFAAMNILAQRPRIKAEVFTELRKWLKKYGVLLREVSISDIEFDKAYQKAIEDKQVQFEEARKLKYKLQQARLKAQIVVVNAKARADARIKQAEGQAKALVIEGQAIAKKNKLVAASLTRELISYIQARRWDGVVPRIMLGGSTGTLLQLPGIAGARSNKRK